MRIMGLDYGDRKIGVAVSDMFGWTAQGLEVVERRRDGRKCSELRIWSASRKWKKSWLASRRT